MKLDSRLKERLTELYKDYQKEVRGCCSFGDFASAHEIILKKLAVLEAKAFGESKSEMQNQPTNNAATSPGKEGNVLTESSTVGKENGKAKSTDQGKGEKSNSLMEDATTANSKGKERDMLFEGTTPSQGNGKEHGFNEGEAKKGRKKGKRGKRKSKEKNVLQVDDAMTTDAKCEEHDVLKKGSMINKGKGKEDELRIEVPVIETDTSEDNDSPQGGVPIDKDKAEASNVHAKAPVIGKANGKGEESDKLLEGSAKGKGKHEENDLPPAASADNGAEGIHGDTAERHNYPDLLREAKALFIDPKTGTYHKAMNLSFRNMFEFCNSAPVEGPYEELELDAIDDYSLMTYKHVYDLMEQAIRPQIASPGDVELVCNVLRHPQMFAAVRPWIYELNWGR